MTKMKITFASSFSLVLIASLALPSSATILTTNGGFEAGDFTGWTPTPSLPGQQTITSTNPHSGTYAAEINNDNSTAPPSNSFIDQAQLGAGLISPGQTIDISFAARGEFGVGGVAFAEFYSLNSVGGVTKSEILGGGPLAVDPDPNVWKVFNFTTTASAADVSGGVTLRLGATTGAATGSFAHMWYDDVSVSIIPEPATFALLGFVGLGLVCRGRKQNA